ncbi:protein of unknown function [Flavobacterium segetis]|uniref:Uncharacterized protein n=1 Tax=Flavobacterium segetis TaxID=271157 RepID=A0A1M5GSD8_9FLAO|nr:DUF4105 domain-containing protein [Flavobacterium segetis]SHG06528.1 protein of unknown function [Flavobacterium segetis]
MLAHFFPFKKYLIAALLLFISFSSFSQSIILSQNTHISILTCGTGNEVYSLFGHTAIRIQDTVNNVDLVYNYGAFDFNTPNFVMKFTKGDLQYFAVINSYPDFINQYQYEKRTVYEQELNISLELKQKLFDQLNTSLASGESYYTYKFIDKNCTSMVVDILNKTLGGNIVVKKEDTDLSYRSILYPYFDGHFYEKLGTSIIFGTKVDQKGTQIFLPLELKKSLEKIVFNKIPLAKKSETVLEFTSETLFSWWNNVYMYILLLLAIIIINKKSTTVFYFTIMGIIGLFFTLVGFYSQHLELGYNYNILLFNPTLLAILFLYWKKNKQGLYILALLNLLCLVVYLSGVINKAHLLIVLPLIITNAILLIRILIENRTKTPVII